MRRRRRTKVTRVSWTTGRVSTRPEVVERTAGRACACDRVLRESSGQPPPPPKTTDGRLTAGTRPLENIYRILSSHNGGRDGGCWNRRWAHHRGCWVEPARAAGGGPQPGRDGVCGKPRFAGTCGRRGTNTNKPSMHQMLFGSSTAVRLTNAVGGTHTRPVDSMEHRQLVEHSQTQTMTAIHIKTYTDPYTRIPHHRPNSTISTNRSLRRLFSRFSSKPAPWLRCTSRRIG